MAAIHTYTSFCQPKAWECKGECEQAWKYLTLCCGSDSGPGEWVLPWPASVPLKPIHSVHFVFESSSCPNSHWFCHCLYHWCSTFFNLEEKKLLSCATEAWDKEGKACIINIKWTFFFIIISPFDPHSTGTHNGGQVCDTVFGPVKVAASSYITLYKCTLVFGIIFQAAHVGISHRHFLI